MLFTCGFQIDFTRQFQGRFRDKPRGGYHNPTRPTSNKLLDESGGVSQKHFGWGFLVNFKTFTEESSGALQTNSDKVSTYINPEEVPKSCHEVARLKRGYHVKPVLVQMRILRRFLDEFHSRILTRFLNGL